MHNIEYIYKLSLNDDQHIKNASIGFMINNEQLQRYVKNLKKKIIIDHLVELISTNKLLPSRRDYG